MRVEDNKEFIKELEEQEYKDTFGDSKGSFEEMEIEKELNKRKGY